MKGKVADVVMAVRNGEQIVRKYQPIVANPNTESQVASRAKLKLMSQLSAVMSPVIAMRRQGNISSRNMFVKNNYRATTFQNSQADVNLTAIKLTQSVVTLTPLGLSRSGSKIRAFHNAIGVWDISRLVYAMFVKTEEGELRYFNSLVATQAGTNNDWAVEFNDFNGEVVVYSYAVRDNTDAARTVFGNMQTLSGEDVAKLVTSRTLTEADVTLSETRSAVLPAANRDVEPNKSEAESKKKA